MICQPCRSDSPLDHLKCPEIKRRDSAKGLTPLEKAGSQWCECQHRPRDRPFSQQPQPHADSAAVVSDLSGADDAAAVQDANGHSGLTFTAW